MGYEAPTQRKSRKTHGHKVCPRCGNKSLNVKKKECVKCGFGASARRNDVSGKKNKKNL